MYPNSRGCPGGAFTPYGGLRRRSPVGGRQANETDAPARVLMVRRFGLLRDAVRSDSSPADDPIVGHLRPERIDCGACETEERVACSCIDASI